MKYKQFNSKTKNKVLGQLQIIIKRSRLAGKERNFISLSFVICSLLYVSCNLFNSPTNSKFFEKIDDEIAYANAPWVPLRIETGGLGTAAPTGPQNNLVKKGYSFSLYFQPSLAYPFMGWQAWIEGEGIIAFWKPSEEYGTERVWFSPKNSEGTEAEIFIYEKPTGGKPLFIGPWGASSEELAVTLDAAALGVLSPATVSGIKQDYPFTLSFQPDPAYPFRGWQALFSDGTLSVWETGGQEMSMGGISWAPRNVLGTEISITITNPAATAVTISPLGADTKAVLVRVAVPEGWGTASPSGTLSRRLGYSFGVEFSPSSAWLFAGWRAYRDTGQPPAAPGVPLGVDDVIFTGTNLEEGQTAAQVTVRTEGNVLLVPFCLERPRILRSNPPLSGASIAFPFDQKISLYFNMPINMDTVWTDSISKNIGNNIQITAVHASGPNIGMNVGVDGDITGYFEAQPFDMDEYRLVLAAKDTVPSIDLQEINITAVIGPGIADDNGVTMAAAEIVRYITSASQSQKVYEAGRIEASRVSGSGYFWDAGTQWNNPSIDRRFNGTSLNTAYIRIPYPVTPPEDVTLPPNRITVIEYQTVDLNGTNILPVIFNRVDYPTPAQAGGYYSLNHTLQTVSHGIVQLIVLPWYEDTLVPANNIEMQIPTTALASGRYVTIVMDTAAPVLVNPGAEIIGHTATAGVYVYGGDNTHLTLRLNQLNQLKDIGTPVSQAWTGPWTMDDSAQLKWRIIAKVPGETTETILSLGHAEADINGWLPAYHSGNIYNVLQNADISAVPALLTLNTRYKLYAQFLDSMGNASIVAAPLTSSTGADIEIQLSNLVSLPVTALSALINGIGNQITVSWTLPEGMDGAILSINNIQQQDITRGAATGDILQTSAVSVPVINTAYVRNGQAVSNVMRYGIKVESYNIAGRASAKELPIWNIPDMSISEANPAIEIENKSDLEAIGSSAELAVSSGKSYVLLQDISITGAWTPIGTGSGTSAFHGKFYGNGRTITIENFSTTLPQYSGLFGYAQDALIRDLCVEYADPPSVSRAGGLYFGGIAGRAEGTAIIRNVVVGNGKGKVTVTNTYGTNNDFSPTYAGMITGCIEPTVLIENCYAGLELEVTASGYSGIHAGGITGFIAAGGTSAAAMIDRVTMAGTVNAKSNQNSGINAANYIFIGGIAGECLGLGIIQNSEVLGTIEMSAISISTNDNLDYILGGIIGRMRDGQMLSCHFTGEINVPASHDVARQTIVGGLAGALGGVWDNAIQTDVNIAEVLLKDSSATGDIVITLACYSKLMLGGVFGTLFGASAANRINFINCEYSEGQIHFSRTAGSAQAHVGGFGGEAVANLSLDNCRSRAGLIKVDYSGSAGDGSGSIGGFIGIFRGDAQGCYSHSPIEANLGGNVNGEISIGGFVGNFNTWSDPPVPASWRINRCYATGSVDVTVNSSSSPVFNVGGFLGNMLDSVRIEDSYAIGDVIFDRVTAGGQSFIGGFVGYVKSATGIVGHCFSTGSVTSNNNSYDYYSVGGLLGELLAGAVLSNSAALGSFVIMHGPGTYSASDRIGRLTGLNGGSISASYVINTMSLYHSKTYKGALGTPLSLSPAPAANNMHGANVSINDVRKADFWLDTSGLSFNYDSTIGGMGGIHNTWDFNGIEGRGYPTLIGVGGQ